MRKICNYQDFTYPCVQLKLKAPGVGYSVDKLLTLILRVAALAQLLLSYSYSDFLPLEELFNVLLASFHTAIVP